LNKPQLVTVLTIAVILGAVGYLALTTQIKQNEDRAALVDHRHVRLFIIDNGQNVTIPANIGFSSALWQNRTLDAYGIRGYAPLHTHGEDGVIHVEAREVRNWTLGDFIEIWGSDFPTGSLVFTDNAGEPHTEANIVDYRSHVLKDLETITVHYPEYYGPALPEDNLLP